MWARAQTLPSHCKGSGSETRFYLLGEIPPPPQKKRECLFMSSCSIHIQNWNTQYYATSQVKIECTATETEQADYWTYSYCGR